MDEDLEFLFNQRNAENARKEAQMQRKEIQKLHHAQQKVSRDLESKEKEKRLQSELFQLSSSINVDYQLVLTKPYTKGGSFSAKLLKKARVFLKNVTHYLSITDHKNYSSLEYKELASKTRSTIETILEKAISADMSHTLNDIKNDYELISSQPTKKLAMDMAKKYRPDIRRRLVTGRLVTVGLTKTYNDSNYTSLHHKKLAQQARSALDSLTQHEWFQWGATQLAAQEEEEESRKRKRGFIKKIEMEEQEKKGARMGLIIFILIVLLILDKACNS